MSTERVEIYPRAGWRRRRAGLIAMGVVLLPLLVYYFFNPPMGTSAGTAGLIAQGIALLGGPAVLLMIVGAVRALIRQAPLLVIDSSGGVVDAWLKAHAFGWDEVQKLSKHERKPDVLIVHLRSGNEIRVEAQEFEKEWDRDRIAAEMHRLSGGRFGRGGR